MWVCVGVCGCECVSVGGVGSNIRRAAVLAHHVSPQDTIRLFQVEVKRVCVEVCWSCKSGGGQKEGGRGRESRLSGALA